MRRYVLSTVMQQCDHLASNSRLHAALARTVGSGRTKVSCKSWGVYLGGQPQTAMTLNVIAVGWQTARGSSAVGSLLDGHLLGSISTTPQPHANLQQATRSWVSCSFDAVVLLTLKLSWALCPECSHLWRSNWSPIWPKLGLFLP